MQTTYSQNLRRKEYVFNTKKTKIEGMEIERKKDCFYNLQVIE